MVAFEAPSRLKVVAALPMVKLVGVTKRLAVPAEESRFPATVVKLPLAITVLVAPEVSITLPVVVPPMVRSAPFTVARFPLPVKYVALPAVEPAILAVGVPLRTPVNANLAEVVAELPMSRSRVVLPG
jgi:hypothetical protein